MDSSQILITIPLKDFLESHFGIGLNMHGEHMHMWSHRHIPFHIAEIIKAKTKNQEICYVQMADQYNPTLKQPVLWDYAAWRSSVDTWERQRNRAAMERADRFVFEANMKLIAKAVAVKYLIEGDAANITAYKLLKRQNYNGIKEVGVAKLYTSIEEIP